MKPFINIHTHHFVSGQLAIINSSNKSLLVDDVHYSYGIHPWNIGSTNIETELENLENFCSENKLLAIGEIGLDRAIQTSIDTQKEVFIEQLEIANRYCLPVIIHCVKAWSDILSVRKKGKYATPWIIHGYTGNLQTAEQLVKSGCYLSFGSKLLNNQSVQLNFKLLPINDIFLETDDSDAKIEEIYTKAAELYDICTDELKTKIYQNFTKVFGTQWVQNG